MSILAKKEGVLRLIGTSIILVGMLLSLIFDFFLLKQNVPSYFFIIITLIPIISSVVCLKLELNIFRNNLKKFVFLNICYLTLMIIIGIFLRPNDEFILPLIIIIISNVLIILCWHFSFSIYKKEKVIFIISGLGYILTTAIFKMYSIISQLGLYMSLIPFILIIFGICDIIIVETRMKKKGLLNYI